MPCIDGRKCKVQCIYMYIASLYIDAHHINCGISKTERRPCRSNMIATLVFKMICSCAANNKRFQVLWWFRCFISIGFVSYLFCSHSLSIPPPISKDTFLSLTFASSSIYSSCCICYCLLGLIFIAVDFTWFNFCFLSHASYRSVHSETKSCIHKNGKHNISWCTWIIDH